MIHFIAEICFLERYNTIFSLIVAPLYLRRISNNGVPIYE
jgi:hypothetical protein